MTEKHKRKLSESHKGSKNPMFGKKLSEEHKRKISQNNGKYWLGKKRDKPTIEKLSKARLGKARPGNPENWKHSAETKKKIGDMKRGDKCHFWRGGISYDPYPEDWTDVLRESIRIRDGYICQLCGIHQDELQDRFKKLDCHHIDYDKTNCNPDNLISLCRSCHQKTNFDREYWIKRLVQ